MVFRVLWRFTSRLHVPLLSASCADSASALTATICWPLRSPLLSQASSLLWVSPTPDVSFASLRSFESLRSHTASGTRQVSRVCTQYLVRSPRSPPLAEPTHSCLSFAHCCLLWQTPHRLPLYMNYGALSLHAFALRLSHSSAYAWTPPRGFGSKAEYRLLAELYRAGSSTRLYCVHRTGARLKSL